MYLAVKDGDTLESLSVESGFSKAKLQEANGGELSQTPSGIQVLLQFVCGVRMLMSASLVSFSSKLHSIIVFRHGH